MYDQDTELMLRFQHGDTGAFDVLFRKYYPRVVSFARRYRKDRAEDAAQEVFLRIATARASYLPSAPFSAYLFRIAANTCISELRKRAPMLVSGGFDTLPSSETPLDVVTAHELEQALARALQRLTPAQRQAWHLLRTEDMSYHDIASAMCTSMSAIKSLLNRARADLTCALTWAQG